MASLAVFADYLDFRARAIVATATVEQSCETMLRRMICKHNATNIVGPFNYAVGDDGEASFTPRAWPSERIAALST